MKIAVTGGHLTPAVAVIEQLLQNKKNKVVFFGRKHTFEGDNTLSLEYRTIKRMNIPFREVKSGKIKRHLTPDAISSLLKIPKGYLTTQKKIDREEPDILLSFGGYLALPVAIACKRRGIPIVTHEQTQQAGMSNKLIAKLADKVCVSFKQSENEFPKDKTTLTGNPLRPEIFQIMQKIHVSKNKKLLFVTGGSAGSHAINMLVKKSLQKLLENWTVIHQTGDTKLTDDYNTLQTARNQLSADKKEQYIIKKYVAANEIGWIYKNAEVIVGRAGINTVLELLATNSRALLFPLSTGQKNEQLKNAQMYANSGLGEYMTHNPQPEEFVAKLAAIAQKERNASKLDTIHKDAAENIAKIVQKVYEEKREKTT